MRKNNIPSGFIFVESGWYTYKELIKETGYNYFYVLKKVRELDLRNKTFKGIDTKGRARNDLVKVFWPGVDKIKKK